jgi:hypothetical protein
VARYLFPADLRSTQTLMWVSMAPMGEVEGLATQVEALLATRATCRPAYLLKVVAIRFWAHRPREDFLPSSQTLHLSINLLDLLLLDQLKLA